MQRLAATPVLFAILLSGCVTPQSIPEMSRPQSSGLGIEIRVDGAAANQVYFVRIDNEDGLLQQQIFNSNYVKDGLNADGTPGTPPRAYFLNAPPGTYVAVAGFRIKGAIGGTFQFTYYFEKKLVELTKVTVRENEFVFMGSYEVGESGHFGFDRFAGADQIQTHYKNIIAPEATTNAAFMFFQRNNHLLGTLREHKNDEVSRNEFFLRAKEDLAGTKWTERFR
jgi:hypothetical protein